MNSNALEVKPKTITLYDIFNYVLSSMITIVVFF